MRARSGLVGLCAIALLILSEIGLRLVGFGSPLLYRASLDPEGKGQYEPVPDQRVVRLGKETRINKLGTRGPDVKPTPPKGVFRILILGDSVTNGGTQVNDDETYPARMESRLRAVGCNSEVLNASAGGWSIFNEAGWLRVHGLKGAQLLLLSINIGDLYQMPERSVLEYNVSFPTQRPAFAIQEVIVRYLLPALNNGSGSIDPGAKMTAAGPLGERRVLAEIDQMRQFAHDHEIEMAIVVWNMPISDDPVLSARGKRLVEFGRQAGVPVLMLPQLSPAERQLLMRDDIHPNGAGNRWIADRVTPHILKVCRSFQRNLEYLPLADG